VHPRRVPQQQDGYRRTCGGAPAEPRGGTTHKGAWPHNQRALAEIYLLSFCDRIVTTAVSTFGYAAHDLAGVRPLVLLWSPSPETPAEPPCIRSLSVEPCLHAPPWRLCDTPEGSDIGALMPYVRHCEDVHTGLK
jgi:xyloglucan fucosyltransferase